VGQKVASRPGGRTRKNVLEYLWGAGVLTPVVW